MLIKWLKRQKSKLWLLHRDVIINSIAMSVVCPRILRKFILNAYGMKIGSLAICGRSFFTNKKVSVGEGCFINYECYFDAQADIVIEDNVFVGHRVSFVTSTHEFGNPEKRAGKPFAKPIYIGGGLGLVQAVVY